MFGTKSADGLRIPAGPKDRDAMLLRLTNDLLEEQRETNRLLRELLSGGGSGHPARTS